MMDLLKNLIEVPLVRAQVGAATEVADQTQDQLTQLVSTVLAKIPLWITAFIVIILSFVIARIVKSSVENKLAAEGFEEEHKELSIVAGRSANAIVLTVGLTVGLKIAGIDLTTIIAAGAFGIGFALKDLIMNFIAGVMILTARHFTIGDIIKVNGVLGKIEEIQSRATVVKNFDGTKVVIPNAELFINPVTSYTSNPFRRVTVIVGVTYETDLKKAVEVCKIAAQRTRNVLAEPKIKVFVYEFGDSSVNIKVNVWVESKKGIIRVRNDLINELSAAFDEFGIEQPYPIYTIEFGNETGLVDSVKNRLEGKKSRKGEEMKEQLKKEAQLEKNLELEAAAAKPETSAAPADAASGNLNTEQGNQNAPQWLQEAAKGNNVQGAEDKSVIPAPAASSLPAESGASPAASAPTPAEPASEPSAGAPIPNQTASAQPSAEPAAATAPVPLPASSAPSAPPTAEPPSIEADANGQPAVPASPEQKSSVSRN